MDIKRLSKITLVLLFLVSIAQVTFTKYVPSLDGPQHLYAINILDQIIKGNPIVKEYFQINPVIVGYWFPHFIIGLFNLILPSWLAEKLYLIIYIIGMALSFRYLIQSIRPKTDSPLWVLIFPFIFSAYQLLGYYAFSFAAIFYFINLGYWFRNADRFNLKRGILFALLIIGLFLSHGLVFVFWCFSIAIVVLAQFAHHYLGNNSKIEWKPWITKIAFLGFAALPALVLWYHYIRNVMQINDVVSGYVTDKHHQILEFMRLRLLVGFDHKKESVTFIPLFILLVVLTAIVAYRFFKIKENKKIRIVLTTLTKDKNIFILISFFFFLLYFFAPNRISAGSLTNRFGLYIFYNLVVWLALNPFKPFINKITLLVIVISMIYTRTYHISVYKKLNKQITALKEVEKQVPPNSFVTEFLESPNWLHLHFAHYIGTDIPVISTNAPQCRGQFPLKLKYSDLPPIYLVNKEVTPKLNLYEREQKKHVKFVDYVVVFYDNLFWKSDENKERQELLNTFFEQTYVSKNKMVGLYKYHIPDGLSDSISIIQQNKPLILNLEKKAANNKTYLEDMVQIEALESYLK